MPPNSWVSSKTEYARIGVKEDGDEMDHFQKMVVSPSVLKSLSKDNAGIFLSLP